MGYKLTEYTNLNKWFEKLHSLPSFEENLEGSEVLAEIVNSCYDEPVY